MDFKEKQLGSGYPMLPFPKTQKPVLHKNLYLRRNFQLANSLLKKKLKDLNFETLSSTLRKRHYAKIALPTKETDFEVASYNENPEAVLSAFLKNRAIESELTKNFSRTKNIFDRAIKTLLANDSFFQQEVLLKTLLVLETYATQNSKRLLDCLSELESFRSSFEKNLGKLAGIKTDLSLKRKQLAILNSLKDIFIKKQNLESFISSENVYKAFKLLEKMFQQLADSGFSTVSFYDKFLLKLNTKKQLLTGLIFIKFTETVKHLFMVLVEPNMFRNFHDMNKKELTESEERFKNFFLEVAAETEGLSTLVAYKKEMFEFKKRSRSSLFAEVYFGPFEENVELLEKLDQKESVLVNFAETTIEVFNKILFRDVEINEEEKGEKNEEGGGIVSLLPLNRLFSTEKKRSSLSLSSLFGFNTKKEDKEKKKNVNPGFVKFYLKTEPLSKSSKFQQRLSDNARFANFPEVDKFCENMLKAFLLLEKFVFVSKICKPELKQIFFFVFDDLFAALVIVMNVLVEKDRASFFINLLSVSVSVWRSFPEAQEAFRKSFSTAAHKFVLSFHTKSILTFHEQVEREENWKLEYSEEGKERQRYLHHIESIDPERATKKAVDNLVRCLTNRKKKLRNSFLVSFKHLYTLLVVYLELKMLEESVTQENDDFCENCALDLLSVLEKAIGTKLGVLDTTEIASLKTLLILCKSIDQLLETVLDLESYFNTNENTLRRKYDAVIASLDSKKTVALEKIVQIINIDLESIEDDTKIETRKVVYNKMLEAGTEKSDIDKIQTQLIK